MVSERSTISGILDVLAELHAKEKEQAAALDQTRADIAAAERVLGLIRDHQGLPAETPVDGISADQLRGKTQHQALIDIAQASGGRVRVKDAKRLFIAAGLSSNPKTLYQQITSTLIRSDKFEHSGKGEYSLVERVPRVNGPISFQLSSDEALADGREEIASR